MPVRRAVALILAATALVAPAAAEARPSGPLAWRGIVEGAYGRPWTGQERADMLAWMARHGFNAYVHAPKEDLYPLTQWRDPYPPAEQQAFDREIRFAQRRGIAWIPNLSPAVPLIPTPAAPEGVPSRDLCFSCPEDLEVVRSKLAPFVAAGARTVMISFDDVSKVMTHPQDLARYGAGDEAFGRANGEFLTRLHDSYGGGVRVLTVGADYQGTADTAYLRGLRATLDPAVEVMWTGTNVPSEDFAPDDARAYAQWIGRTPLVWDNWTNTDTAGSALGDMEARIFLGPYKRRADVAGAIGGIFLNAANDAHVNKLPLATAAAWMVDPRGYEADRAWGRALRELAGRPRAEDLRAFAETSWSNKLDRETEAPTFVARSRALLDAYAEGGGWPAPYARLDRELDRVRRAPDTLPRMRDAAVAEQFGPFVAAAAQGATAGDLGAGLLAAERPSLSVRRARGGRFAGRAAPPGPARAAVLRAELERARRAFETDRRFTYGWRLPVAFEIPPYAVPRNAMSAFLDEVRSLDAAWAPRGPVAASDVTLRLDGREVPLDEDGGFTLPRGACGGVLEAEDAAGGLTALRLPRCTGIQGP